MFKVNEASELDQHANQLKNLRAPLTDELIPSDLRDVFNSQLHLYQRETVNFLIQRYNEYMRGLDNPELKSTDQDLKKLTGFIIGHEMGLGKTIMVLFFLRCIVKHPHPIMRPQRIIIVVQKVLLQQWKQEIINWCQTVPLYTYHGSSRERRKKLMCAKNERVCIILTTYAMISNDGEYIMSILKDEPVPHTDLIPIIDIDSTNEDSISSTDSNSTTSVAPEVAISNEAGTFNKSNQETSNSDNSFLDPVLEFSWMMKKQSKNNEADAAAIAGRRLERLSLQTIPEPNIKHSNSNTLHHLSQEPVASSVQLPTTNTDSDVKQSENNLEDIMHCQPPPANQLPKHCIDILIMDEATAIKNTSTKISCGLRSIDVGFKLALTGTPVMNNLGELWSIVDYINPKYLGNKAQFEKNIAKPINEAEAQDATMRERRVARKVRRALREKLHPILIRRTTADLGPLGVNKIAITFWIPLNEIQFVLYSAAIRTKQIQEICRDTTDYTKMIQSLHILRKICDNPCELSTKDTEFFKGDFERVINIIKQKATQPQTLDSDYLHIVKELQIFKGSDQNASKQDILPMNRLDNRTSVTTHNHSTLANDKNSSKQSKRAGQSDAFDNNYTEEEEEENGSSDCDKDAHDWVTQQSFDEYLHRSPDHFDFTVRSITALSSKYTLFMAIINHIRNNNHRVLIFCEYQIVFSMIEHLLSHHDIPYLRLDGTISDVHERNRICTSFNNNKRYTALLISIKLGAMGLNLTGANRIILFAPAWNLQIEEQAIARAYRMGQNRNVVVYKLACINTMEEKIVVKQLQKAAIANVTLNNEKHQSVIKKTDLNNLFEFNANNRLEGQLPENIKQHAKQEHVKLTIQQTLGSSSSTNEKTEADKELEFINSLMNKKLCIDVSVLDYLHSKDNIDKETDICEQVQSQIQGSQSQQHGLQQQESSNFDKILALGIDASISAEPKEQNKPKSDYSQLLSIYLLTHQYDYLKKSMSIVLSFYGINPLYFDNTLNEYYTRIHQNISAAKRNNNLSVHLPKQSLNFINSGSRIYVYRWQQYLSCATLIISINPANINKALSFLQQTSISSQARIEVIEKSAELDNMYSYFKFQLNSIIAHFTVEIKQILIANMVDICEICCTDTPEEYATYLHNLAVNRLKLFLTDRIAFNAMPNYPATLDIICSLCQSMGASLTTLIMEYNNPRNWIDPRFKSLFSMIKEREPIPLLWGPMAKEFIEVQKQTLLALLKKAHDRIDYSLFNRCLFQSESMDTESQTIKELSNTISIKNVEDCFTKELNTTQKKLVFSNILSQYNLMNTDIKVIIIRNTYKKLCYYQTMSLKHVQSTISTSVKSNTPSTIPRPETVTVPHIIPSSTSNAMHQPSIEDESINCNRNESNHNEINCSVDTDFSIDILS